MSESIALLGLKAHFQQTNTCDSKHIKNNSHMAISVSGETQVGGTAGLCAQ
ncbi:rCG62932 [Rattus norvegicus]|uniref:RCG62932 n=1 Tax=Rattus norvegicus TaxID=10116 RepID=A6I2M1_RAT|nr:rCG62932 [Rattus norvegicus]